MLQLPDGQWTNTLDEAYTHLLDTHFPGNSKVDKHRVTNIPRRMPLFNRDAVQCIITEDHIKWTIGSMAPFKTPGLDGIYPVFLQKGLRFLSHPICCIYRASLSSGYIPKIWREVSHICTQTG